MSSTKKGKTLTEDIGEMARPDWTPEDAVALYMIDRWGDGYFDVDEQGELTVAPLQEQGASISIYKVLQEALAQGLLPPILIRFQDLARHRVRALNEAFLSAIEEFGYKGHYRGVYPLKVNQLHEVVEEILEAGRPYGFGLEAGSKCE